MKPLLIAFAAAAVFIGGALCFTGGGQNTSPEATPAKITLLLSMENR